MFKNETVNTQDTTTEAPINKCQYLLIFDCVNGNPNGSPDHANRPRMNDETGHGLISDVSLKRKIRDYVYSRGVDVFIKNGVFIQNILKEACEACPTNEGGLNVGAQKYLADKFWDVRTFGAVLSTKSGVDAEKPEDEEEPEVEDTKKKKGGKAPKKPKTAVHAGVVRGPVAVDWGTSVAPIAPVEHGITRCCSIDPKAKDDTSMGRKWILPYGLYTQRVFVDPMLMPKSGCTKADLILLEEALLNLWEAINVTSHGRMTLRVLIKFEHSSPRGSAPSHKLFELVKVKATKEQPQCFEDYEISVAPEGQPYSDVKLQVLVTP